MDDVNVLKEQIKVLEIQLSDSNKKLSLNRQYSSTLEDKISEMDSSRLFIRMFLLLLFYF